MASTRAPQAPQYSSRLAPVKAEARRTGIPYTSLRDIIHRGEIPLIRIGRAQYVEKADVDAWIIDPHDAKRLGDDRVFQEDLHGAAVELLEEASSQLYWIASLPAPLLNMPVPDDDEVNVFNQSNTHEQNHERFQMQVLSGLVDTYRRRKRRRQDQENDSAA